MTIKGVLHTEQSNCWHCVVSDFSDELQSLIRKNLNAICYGLDRVEQEKDYYTYRKTLLSFLERYKTKSKIIKKGMLGEMLAHVLISKYFDKFLRTTLFFNKEEQSIKKGFDAIFFEADKKKLWYGEIKAGEKTKKSATDTNKALLSKAKSDIKSKLSSKSDTYWDNALIDAAVTLKEDVRKNLKKILQGDAPTKRVNTNLSGNIFLITVVYGNCDEKIEMKSLSSARDKAIKEGFETVVYSIQKNTYEKIEKFLLEEVKKNT